jgi:hypothetical protein
LLPCSTDPNTCQKRRGEREITCRNFQEMGQDCRHVCGGLERSVRNAFDSFPCSITTDTG